MWDTVSGTWQQIDGGWSLMEDRLGIEVTVDDPESWNIGKPPAGTAAQEPTGVLHGITSICNPSSTIQSEKMFWLRLTTVIEADYGIEATAQRRDASPMSSTILRRVDARDHFHYDVVDGSSAFNPSPGTDQVDARRHRRRAGTRMPASHRTRVPASGRRGHHADARRITSRSATEFLRSTAATSRFSSIRGSSKARRQATRSSWA